MVSFASNLLVELRFLLVFLLILTVPALRAGSVSAAPAEGAESSSALQKWWDGRRVTGDWLGLREKVAERGLAVGGSWRAIYFGVLDSEGGSGSFFAEELVFNARLDFAKLTAAEALEGWEAFGEVRWREPGRSAVPNSIVDANSPFNPSRFSGGVGWRLVAFGLSYCTPEILGVEDLLTLKAGWLRPQREFIDNTFGGLFVNNALGSARAIGANVPFGSSFSTWGGTIEVEPNDWQYTKLGLFMSFPDASEPSNHGLMFQGYAPDPAQNGLFFLGETGVTPDLGPAELPGRYAFGGYFYGDDAPDSFGDRYGFYWQANQMVFREPGAGEQSPQGLSGFGLLTFAPDGWSNRYTLSFQSGLTYEGAIPGRDRDQVMAALAFGEYSDRSRAGENPAPTSTAVVELGYRIRVNGWAYFQPYFQYIIQPDGTPGVADASVLGFFAGVDF
jgi:carbohydrate-selective porin OprB